MARFRAGLHSSLQIKRVRAYVFLAAPACSSYISGEITRTGRKYQADVRRIAPDRHQSTRLEQSAPDLMHSLREFLCPTVGFTGCDPAASD